MGLYLVPTDAGWLGDVRLREVLIENFKAKLEDAVRGLSLTREFANGTDDIRVTTLGNEVQIEIRGGKAVALEKGVQPHQMTHLEGVTVPIKTPTGTIFRKVTSLSLLLGKWRSRGFEERERVKKAVDRALSDSAETVVETKVQLEGNAPPRIQDILGVQ